MTHSYVSVILSAFDGTRTIVDHEGEEGGVLGAVTNKKLRSGAPGGEGRVCFPEKVMSHYG